MANVGPAQSGEAMALPTRRKNPRGIPAALNHDARDANDSLAHALGGDLLTNSLTSQVVVAETLDRIDRRPCAVVIPRHQ